jgi:tRNA(Ile2)-agmatinylcytidine synthase
MWIGVDDTDGPDGGCTTFVLTEIVDEARRLGLDVIGEPRLVRLNPNIPWKTRGNGALAARFGHGRGSRRKIGEIRGRPIWSYARGAPLSGRDRRRLLDAAWAAVGRSRSHDRGSDPAMIASVRSLDGSLYREAVSSEVGLPTAMRALRHAHAEIRTDGSRRGLVGAAAAVAWPAKRVTWELLAYRRPGRIGAARRVQARTVRRAAARFRSLFLCYDARTRRLLVAPHTACPILYGLRSTDPTVLDRARRMVGSEPVDRWLVFRTNQGTGDHLRPRPIGDLRPFDAARLVGTVSRAPETRPGGHVRFELRDASGAVGCVAFEPTKTLPSVARSLRVGDELAVWGGRGRDRTFRLEGIVVRRPVPRVRTAPPRCAGCGRTAGSLGTGRGYRCPGCHRRFPPEAARRIRERPAFGRGTYHPTPSARRHIAPRGPEVTGAAGDL